jgi:Zn-dependent protease with chaperone function
MLRILLVMAFAIYAYSDKIKRERSALREGPGPWYPLLVELSSGSEVLTIENKGEWRFVEYEGKRGYVAKRAFFGKKKKVDPLWRLSSSSEKSSISHAGVTAAVKGFAERFSKHLKTDYSQLDVFQNSLISPKSFLEFKKETLDFKKEKVLLEKFPLSSQESEGVFSFAEEGSGLAIALKISSLGLFEDNELVKYVNHVGAFVAEQSHGYDMNFRFHIIDSPSVNGYACPGGIIFITRGALETMRSEAELACFLGHEIAHVTARHGLQEMEHRKIQIKSGNAVDAMNRAFGEEEIDEDIAHLEEVAILSYQRIFTGRLSEYEEEADALGLLYATRAGYNPVAMVDFLKRLKAKNVSQESEHYSVKENSLRISRLKRRLAEQQLNTQLFQAHSQRFLDVSLALNKK